MARPTKIGPSNILDAAERMLLAHGGVALTMDVVTTAADCAKGLVHYHFGTRAKLLAATNDRLWDKRDRDWAAALGGRAPEDCVRDTWSLLARETADGVTRAWLSLLLDPDRTVSQAVRRRMERFETGFQRAAVALLNRLGLVATIPPDEWSRLLAAGINGVSLQLLGRGRSTSMEADYAAVWLSALGLTRSGN